MDLGVSRSWPTAPRGRPRCPSWAARQRADCCNHGEVHLELMRTIDSVFPRITSSDSNLSARIWHCRYRTPAPLASLVNLRKLEIAGHPDPTLEPQRALTVLEDLRIVHLPQVADLAPLSGLAACGGLSWPRCRAATPQARSLRWIRWHRWSHCRFWRRSTSVRHKNREPGSLRDQRQAVEPGHRDQGAVAPCWRYVYQPK